MNTEKNSTVWRSLALLWMAHFLVDFMIGIWPVFKTIRQIDLGTAGIITAFAVVIGEGLQPLFGALSDAGWRKIVLIGGVLATAASTVFVYSNNYYVLFFMLMVTFMGSGAFHPSATSLASSLSKQKKALFISLFASGGALGLAVSQLLFTATYVTFEGNTWILALPVAVIALLIAVNLSQRRGSKPLQEKKRLDLSSIKKFFCRRELRNLYFIQVFNQSIWWGLIFLLPDILTQRGYETWISLGGGHFVLILGAAAMMIPAGYIADRYTTKKVLFVASLCSITGLYTFVLLPDLAITPLFCLLFALGAVLGVVNPISIAQGHRWAPNNPGLISSMMMGLAWCLAEGIGQGLAGLLSELFIYDAAAKAIAVEGIFLFGFTILTARLPEDAEVEVEEDTLAIDRQ